MPNQGPLKALIAGGGIGGLTAAIALRRAGADVVVFDRAAALGKIQAGVGMALWRNAMHALKEIGLAEAMQAEGAPIHHLEFRTRRGEMLARAAVSDGSERPAQCSVAISRPEVHRTLVNALDDGILRLGSECVDFEQDASSVTVRLADGSEERGDVLVAADGAYSVLRKKLHPEFAPRYAGYSLWHAITDFETSGLQPGIFYLLWGVGWRFACYRIGKGRLYWSCIAYVPQGGRDSAAGAKTDLLTQFHDWMDPIPAMIAATDPSQIHRVDIFGGDPMPSWGKGRVTLLGDAAHPMTTNLGQGACQAIEDGVVLGRVLGSHTDPVAGLEAYEQVRMARTAAVQKLAWRFNGFNKLETRFGCWMREQLMRLPPGRMIMRQFGTVMDYRV